MIPTEHERHQPEKKTTKREREREREGGRERENCKILLNMLLHYLVVLVWGSGYHNDNDQLLIILSIKLQLMNTSNEVYNQPYWSERITGGERERERGGERERERERERGREREREREREGERGRKKEREREEEEEER